MSLDMYHRYIFERENKHLYQTDKGFAKYSYDLSLKPPTLYIEDIYVDHEFRRERIGTKIADEVVEIARKLGCTRLLGSVSPSTRGAHESMLGLIYYGMKLYSATPNMVYFIKEI